MFGLVWSSLVKFSQDCDKFGQVCSILINVGKCWSNLVMYRQCWSNLDMYGQVWSSLVMFCASLVKFGKVLSSFYNFSHI